MSVRSPVRARRPTGPEGGPARDAHALVARDDGDIDLVDVNDRTMWSFGTARHVRLLRELRAMPVPGAYWPACR
ncbi:hypothetical protein [Actinacidiphila oryziradicis]|uniref:hypothetical protein n=1 Tax=Actinacidiphila oryziradicis TaxID=2571141 RepID=UPI0023EFC5C7|nr:hypothetical protein [Actinacidiphila oryziradicis]MCW2871996.1 hypothetical protein [Actinacidiphila oryziradicis]